MTTHVNVFRVMWGHDEIKDSFGINLYWNRIVLEDEVEGLIKTVLKDDSKKTNFFLRVDSIEPNNIDNEKIFRDRLK